jgi:hypothetical protein
MRLRHEADELLDGGQSPAHSAGCL